MNENLLYKKQMEEKKMIENGGKLALGKKAFMWAVVTSYMAIVSIVPDSLVYAASSAAKANQKLHRGLAVVQTIVTGIIVIVGIIAAAKIVITKLPSVDEPHAKNEMWKGIGMVAAAVALGGALTWLIPWVYGLFA